MAKAGDRPRKAAIEWQEATKGRRRSAVESHKAARCRRQQSPACGGSGNFHHFLLVAQKKQIKQPIGHRHSDQLRSKIVTTPFPLPHDYFKLMVESWQVNFLYDWDQYNLSISGAIIRP